MKNIKTLALIAVFAALYFVLSALFKIPIAGHITLDLGYTVLMVAAVYLGPVPAMLVGALGALAESAMMSQTGISIGWILMNALIGVLAGLVLPKTFALKKGTFIWTSVVTVIIAVFLGVCVKTFFDCILRSIALAAKIPTSLAAWATDSIVMLLFGIPVCFLLKVPFSKLRLKK